MVFNKAVRNLYCILQDRMMWRLVNIGLERIWKEVAMAQWQIVLSVWL